MTLSGWQMKKDLTIKTKARQFPFYNPLGFGLISLTADMQNDALMQVRVKGIVDDQHGA